MAVRQHLYALQQEKLVTAEERPVPIGRPAKFWSLTKEAERLGIAGEEAWMILEQISSRSSYRANLGG